jgi:uncharacterized protein YcfJ
MRRTLLAAAGLALAVTSAAEARSRCEAYAHDRRVTGTVVGAIGGGLLGGAVAGHGSKGTGALVGAGLGAVVGNNLSRVSCDREAYYRRHRTHYARARAPAAAGYPRYAAGTAGACHYVSRPYYDQAGRLVYAPMQVCE